MPMDISAQSLESVVSNISDHTSTTSAGTKDWVTFNMFKEFNPDACSARNYMYGVPRSLANETFVEPDTVPAEVKIRAIQGLLPAPPCLRSNQKKRHKKLGTCYPLANPKGLNAKCEVCQLPGRFVCLKCGVTYYCSPDHRQQDSMHTSMCVKLYIIRQKVIISGSNSNESRNQNMRLKNLITYDLLEKTFHTAVTNLYTGKYQLAVAGFKVCIPLLRRTYGDQSCEAVTTYILVADTMLRLKKTFLATKSINKAAMRLRLYTKEQRAKSKAAGSKSKDEPRLLYTRALLFNAQGRLDLEERRFADAIYQFSECVYHTTQVFGPTHLRVCSGYLSLSMAFLAWNRRNEGYASLDFCLSVWYDHLTELFQTLHPDETVAPRKIVLPTNVDAPKLGVIMELEAELQLHEIEAMVAGREDRRMFVKTMICQGIVDMVKNNPYYALQKMDLVHVDLKSINDVKLKKQTRKVWRVAKRQVGTKRFY